MISRKLFVALAFCLAAPAALASGAPALRGDIVTSRDELTLGDLVENAPVSAAGVRLFRAPLLGRDGTIQVSRIVAAAQSLGLRGLRVDGRVQVTVSRAARQVGPAEIEAALRAQLAKDHGADPNATGILFEGGSPALVAPPELTSALAVSDLAFDRRSRRVSATVWLGSSPSARKAQMRVSGQVVELVEVAVVARSVERGGALTSADVVAERRARDLVPADAVHDGAPLEGRVARRALAPGSLLRPADIARPEIVRRGDVVTVTYDMPGVSLALRAKATEGGALGDTVAVINPQSKKALQAVVVGLGRVSVSAPPPGRLAEAKP